MYISQSDRDFTREELKCEGLESVTLEFAKKTGSGCIFRSNRILNAVFCYIDGELHRSSEEITEKGCWVPNPFFTKEWVVANEKFLWGEFFAIK